MPDNITLLPLPPRSPELNPVENIWQFIRDNWLSNRIFRSYKDILDHCCFAWNRLVAELRSQARFDLSEFGRPCHQTDGTPAHP